MKLIDKVFIIKMRKVDQNKSKRFMKWFKNLPKENFDPKSHSLFPFINSIYPTISAHFYKSKRDVWLTIIACENTTQSCGYARFAINKDGPVYNDPLWFCENEDGEYKCMEMNVENIEDIVKEYGGDEY